MLNPVWLKTRITGRKHLMYLSLLGYKRPDEAFMHQSVFALQRFVVHGIKGKLTETFPLSWDWSDFVKWRGPSASRSIDVFIGVHPACFTFNVLSIFFCPLILRTNHRVVPDLAEDWKGWVSFPEVSKSAGWIEEADPLQIHMDFKQILYQKTIKIWLPNS